MRRFIASGSVAVVAIAAHASLAAGQTPPKPPVKRPDSVKVDSLPYKPYLRPDSNVRFLSARGAVRLIHTAADKKKLDSLLLIRDRLPIGSIEMRKLEEEIDHIMSAVFQKGPAGMHSGAFTIVSPREAEGYVMIASRALPFDVAPKGYIGFTVDGHTGGWIDSTGIYVQYAEYPIILRVSPNSPAAKVGIRFGDSLLAYNGMDVRANAINITRMLEPGRNVDVRIRRDGEEREMSMVVVKAPPGMVRAAPFVAGTMARATAGDAAFERRRFEVEAVGAVAPGGRAVAAPPRPTTVATTMAPGILGVRMDDLDPAGIRAISRHKSEHGVLVLRVPEGSPGARMGLKAGDLIISVGNNVDVTSTRQLRRVALSVGSDRPLTYVVLREGKTVRLLYEPK